jgi:hypothetical protein
MFWLETTRINSILRHDRASVHGDGISLQIFLCWKVGARSPSFLTFCTSWSSFLVVVSGLLLTTRTAVTPCCAALDTGRLRTVARITAGGHRRSCRCFSSSTSVPSMFSLASSNSVNKNLPPYRAGLGMYCGRFSRSSCMINATSSASIFVSDSTNASSLRWDSSFTLAPSLSFLSSAQMAKPDLQSATDGA